MRFVVLGTGLVGSALVEHLAARGPPHVVLDHAALSAGGGLARAATAVLRRGDIVLNAAALTNVDACEDRIDEAMEVNGREPGRLAAACVERGATLVHVSTDSVLDVTNVYAKSKALGESLVEKAAGDAALIVRISTVFAPHPRRRDFVRFVVETLREKREVAAVTDMVGSPTYAHDAARALVAAAEGGARGTHAFVNEPSLSRYEFALRIQEVWGAPGVVKPVQMDEMKFKAPRPRDTSMRSTLDAYAKPMTLGACLADYRARWS